MGRAQRNPSRHHAREASRWVSQALNPSYGLYMTGGYGVRLPYNTDKYPRLRGDFAYVGPSYVVPGYAPGVRVGVGPVGVAVGPGYDAYAYDPY